MSGQNKQKTKKERKFHFSQNRNRKALKNGGYSVLLSVIVIAVVVVINLIAGQIPSKYTQVDISTGKLYTIGDETKNLLKNLEEDITIYHIVQPGNEDSNVEKLLQQYEEGSSHIKVEKKDPVVSPEFTSTYTEESVSDNSLIIVGKNRNKVVSGSNIYETEIDYYTYQESITGFDGEGQITSAISYVISDELPILYCLEGHGEISLPSELIERIEKANVELQSLSLLTKDEIPEDAAGLLLNSPEKDYSKEEVRKITEYLKNGGKAMIITDYVGQDMPNYRSILEEYGIQVTDGIVIESDKNKYVQQPYYLVPDINASEVTNGMTGGSSYVLMTGCLGFSVADDVRDTLNISQILTTSDSAFIKTNPENMKSYDKEDGDVDGPCTVGVVISEEVTDIDSDTDGEDTDSTSANEHGQTQIVCFASSTILDESANDMVSDGNYSLYMNSLNWMVDTEESNNMVSIASKSVETQYLTVTAAKAAIFSVILCFLLPAACLIVGGVICYRRRRK